jgi:hypothetical protein
MTAATYHGAILVCPCIAEDGQQPGMCASERREHLRAGTTAWMHAHTHTRTRDTGTKLARTMCKQLSYRMSSVRRTDDNKDA